MRSKAVIAAAALLAAAAGWFLLRDSSDRINTIPIRAGATKPVGTSLGDGFTVARGAQLLGNVFPDRSTSLISGQPAVKEGWQAVLLVTGDPRGVIASYRAEAAKVGIELRSETNYGKSFCGTDAIVKALYSCSASGSSDGHGTVRSFYVDIRRGIDGYVGPVSYAFVTFTKGPAIASSVPDGSADVPLGAAAPALPGGWRSLPSQGQAFLDASNAPSPYYRRKDAARVLPLHVEAGSEVVAPLGAFYASTWLAVLRITGDPAKLARAYARQVDAVVSPSSPIKIERYDVGGATVIKFGAYEAGGSQYYIEIVERGNGPDWMLVTTGYD